MIIDLLIDVLIIIALIYSACNIAITGKYRYAVMFFAVLGLNVYLNLIYA